MSGFFGFPPSQMQIRQILANQTTILTELATLTQKVIAMSATLEAQIQAATAAIQADIATLATDLTSIAAQIASLQSGQTPGSTVTQADVDALNAVRASMDAAVATANSMANPAPATPAPSAPTAG